MPFARPSLTELRNLAVQDVTTSGVPGLTGLLRLAVLRVLSWCMAGLAYSVYGYADWISRMGVPFTAQDEFLYAWAALIGIYPKPATAASGMAQFTANTLPGGATPVLPMGSALTRQDGTPYVTTADGTADGSGNITVPMTATVLGAYTNCDPGTPISIAQPVTGINSGGVTAGQTIGGADQETDDALRTRMLAKYREPPQGGAESDYIEWALEVPGVTRAWCLPLGYGPGTVIVYPMFDDVEAAHGGFPQGTDGVATAEWRGPAATGDQLLVADYIYPLRPVTALNYVIAPTPFAINVTLQALTPDSAELEAAILAALNDMFLAIGEVAGTIYPSQIYQAILAVPGIEYFTMSAPSAPLTAPAGALPIMGQLTVIEPTEGDAAAGL